MKTIISVLISLYFVGCATHSIVKISGSQFVATASDRHIGADGTSVVALIMEKAKSQCGNSEVKVISLSNTGRSAMSHPEATMIFECN